MFFTNSVYVLYVGFQASENLLGCVRNIYFNSQRIHYLSTNIHQQGVSTSSPYGQITDGCTSVDVCASNPCPVNSFCNDEWNLIDCVCLEGWEGQQCEQSIDDCPGKFIGFF